MLGTPLLDVLPSTGLDSFVDFTEPTLSQKYNTTWPREGRVKTWQYHSSTAFTKFSPVLPFHFESCQRQQGLHLDVEVKPSSLRSAAHAPAGCCGGWQPGVKPFCRKENKTTSCQQKQQKQEGVNGRNEMILQIFALWQSRLLVIMQALILNCCVLNKKRNITKTVYKSPDLSCSLQVAFVAVKSHDSLL